MVGVAQSGLLTGLAVRRPDCGAKLPGFQSMSSTHDLEQVNHSVTHSLTCKMGIMIKIGL